MNPKKSNDSAHVSHWTCVLQTWTSVQPLLQPSHVSLAELPPRLLPRAPSPVFHAPHVHVPRARASPSLCASSLPQRRQRRLWRAVPFPCARVPLSPLVLPARQQRALPPHVQRHHYLVHLLVQRTETIGWEVSALHL